MECEFGDCELVAVEEDVFLGRDEGGWCGGCCVGHCACGRSPAGSVYDAEDLVRASERYAHITEAVRDKLFRNLTRRVRDIRKVVRTKNSMLCVVYISENTRKVVRDVSKIILTSLLRTRRNEFRKSIAQPFFTFNNVPLIGIGSSMTYEHGSFGRLTSQFR